MGKIRWSQNSAKTQLKLHKDSDRVENEDPCISNTEQLLNKLRDACKFRNDIQSTFSKVNVLCYSRRQTFNNTKITLYSIEIEEEDSTVSTQAAAIAVDLSVLSRTQACYIKPGTTFKRLSKVLLERVISRSVNQYGTQRINTVAD